MTRILLSSVAAAAVLASAPVAWAQTEIQFWHAMGGNLGETVNELAAGFNKAQSEYKVVPVYKGPYTETLTAAIAAFRAKQAPHIVQVFEVGTANMMAAKGAVYPIYQVMADATEKEGFYKKFPGRDIAVKELTLNPPTENSKGLRIGNFVQIRDVVDEELESVWSGKKDAKAALDEAVKRGNEQLKRFEAANK